jgi:acetoin utilization deacetylase AcuC-like enzyme
MNKLPTFYNRRQSVEKNDSFSPSAGKPEKLIDHLKALNIPIDIVGFDACTTDDLKLVHDPVYIDGLMSGKVMNGFGNTNIAIAESVKWTAGSITAAAVYAYKNKSNTFSPTSGFHHASYHRGSAFCTVNGLMIAALKLIEAGGNKIAIIDLDAHYGNGQVEIIRKLKLEDKVYNYCFSEHCQTARQADKWLVDLKKIISDLKYYDVFHLPSRSRSVHSRPAGWNFNNGAT